MEGEAEEELNLEPGVKLSTSGEAGLLGSAPAPDKFAVVHVGAHQFKVVPGDLIITEKLIGAEVQDKIFLEKVLLVGGVDFTDIGQPLVEGARVLATVEEQTLAEKVIVFKMKRRKQYRRWNGHRQQITVLRIEDIDYSRPSEQLQATA